MKVCFEIPVLTAPSAIALGTFDGLHLGHREVLATMMRAAREQGLAQWVFTFRNHPAEVLRPDQAPPLLTTWQEKLTLLQSFDLDGVVMLPFDRTFSETSPENFVEQVLVGQMRAAHIAVGYNFRFGYQARGNGALLQKMGPLQGFGVSIVPPFDYQQEPVNSTRIRELLAAGELQHALTLLNGDFVLQGEVIQGQGIAAKVLDVPTANLKLPADPKLLPPKGVYACEVLRANGERYQGVMNVGLRPTFDGSALSAETYLFDFSGNLYGETLTVFFKAFLRGEQRFDGPLALKAQIQDDIAHARRVFDASVS
ncbi:MAG: bifunctional riboflavin kinase/FAD synthetase [Candidatus Sericytochromatia bacterium]